jgi:hypothetical protein
VVGQEQREQSGRLAFAGQLIVQHAGQVERTAREVVAGERRTCGSRVAGREQQVDHGQDRVQPGRQLTLRGHAERDPARRDLLLRPRDPGRHRRLRHQERLRDVRDRHAAHQPERQRHLGLARQRRVAAQEHQPQPVVGQ